MTERRTVTREIKNLGLGNPTFKVEEKQVKFGGKWVPASEVQSSGCLSLALMVPTAVLLGVLARHV